MLIMLGVFDIMTVEMNIAGSATGNSLHDLLVQHGEICNRTKKEIHYFDSYWDKGSIWYQTQFLNASQECPYGQYLIDSSPRYIRDPKTPARLKKSYTFSDLADKKFLLILRDPITREISWYKHKVRACVRAIRLGMHRVQSRFDKSQQYSGNDQRPIRKHIKNENTSFYSGIYHQKDICESKRPAHCKAVGCRDIPSSETAVLDDPTTSLRSFEEYYTMGGIDLQDGHYLEQLQRWLGYIRREQIFILHLSTILADTSDVMDRIAHFLGLASSWGSNIQFPHDNPSEVSVTVSCRTYHHLEEYYRRANQGLEKMINRHKAPFEPDFPQLGFDSSVCSP